MTTPRLLLATLLVVSCSDGPVESPPTAELRLEFAENLVPGRTATLHGAHLDRIATLTVDGRPVDLSPGTPAARTFVVPVLRPCEADARPVSIVANGTATLNAPLGAAAPLRMEVGESRTLTAAELQAMKCLQIPAGDEDYVLSVLHLSYEAADRPDTMLTLRTYTWTSTAPALALAPPAAAPDVALGDPVHDDHVARELAAGPRWTGAYAAAPVPFDPAYPTAGIGDTVRFVDWLRITNTSQCGVPRSSAPSYPAVVIALAGSTAVAVDLRLPNAREHLAPATAAIWQKAVMIADPVLLPAVRAVFARDYQPLQGGGGRRYLVIGDVPSAVASDGGTAGAQSACALSSEMVTMRYSGARPLSDEARHPPDAAAIIIHEYAHNAERQTADRLRAGSDYGGWPFEAWPVATEDAGARLALGTASAAPWSSLDARHPNAVIPTGFWARAPHVSPWSRTGMYLLGGSILLYARERHGDAFAASTGSLLYPEFLSRVQPNSDPAGHLAALAAALGTTPTALLDQWAVAHATDDLIAEEAAAARGLPQFRSWATGSLAAGPQGPRGGATNSPNRTLSRTVGAARALAPAPGGYDAAYILADGGRGVSIEVTSVASRPFIARLTRVR